MPLAERDQILGNMGVPIGEKYFYDTYGIPKPEEGEKIVAPHVNPVIASEGAKPSLFSETPLSQDQQDIETLADNSLAEAALDLSPLQEIIDSAESYEDLQKKIQQAYGSNNLKDFRTVLERALFMAELKGRSIT